MKRSFVLILLLLLFTSCATRAIGVYTEYITIESLPSYQIKTPDPRLYNPEYGVKLHISWKTNELSLNDSLDLTLDIIYGDGTEDTFNYTLNEKRGSLAHSLMNEDYFERNGIFSYRVLLFKNCELIGEWKHPLFAKKITFRNTYETSLD